MASDNVCSDRRRFLTTISAGVLTAGGFVNTAGAQEGGETETPTSTPSQSESATLQSIQAVEDRYHETHPVFSDSGQTTTDTFRHNGGVAVFVFEHGGESNFIVELINAETGETVNIVVNEIGTINGAAAMPLSAGEFYMDVDADGEWSVEAVHPTPPLEDIHSVPATASGQGSDVVGPIEASSRVIVAGEHNGESNFIVSGVEETTFEQFNQEFIFNEIGQFEGETTVQLNGIYWIAIEADGEWQLVFENR